MSVSTRCPHCGHVLEGPTWILGRSVLCGQCGQYFTAKSVPSIQRRSGTLIEQPREETLREPDASSEAVDPEATTAPPEPSYRQPPSSQRETVPASPEPPEADAPAVAARPCLGRIARFELQAFLGRGSFGAVYRAYDPVLDRDVALKVPKFSRANTPRVKRFLAEAKAAARLRHPNLVAVYESGQAGDDLYIVSEFVAGVPLSVHLAKAAPSFRQSAQWVRDLALALAYAHGEGIIHRDIKPDNIMIDRALRPQLMDFGLAKRVGQSLAPADACGTPPAPGDVGMTVDGTILGTPAYMAPEQARGDLKAVGPRSDQYSLGVVLYELLTGRKPYQGDPRQVITRVLTELPPPPRRLNRRIPSTLEAVCLKAMAKDPAERYASAGDLAADLQRWLTDEAVGVRPFTRTEQAWRWCRRHPRRLASAAAVTMLLVVLVGLSQARLIFQREEIRRRLEETSLRLEGRLAEQQRQHRAELAQQQRQNEMLLCDLARQTGLHHCAKGNPREGLLFLARSWDAARAIGARERQLAAAQDLLTHTDELPALPEAERLAVPLRNLKSLRQGLPLRDSGRVVFAGFGMRHQPNEGWAILTSDGHSSCLWDAGTGRPLGPAVPYPVPFAAAAFTADGRKVVLSDPPARRLCLADAATGQPLGSTFVSTLATLGPAYVSPTGATVVVCSGGSGPAQWEMWDLRSENQPRLASRAAWQVENVTYRPDGDAFLVRGQEHGAPVLEFWDTTPSASRVARLTPRPPLSPVAACALNPKQNSFAIAWQGTDQRRESACFEAWSGPPQPSLAGQALGQPAQSLQFRADGQALVAADSSEAGQWDFSTLQPIGQRCPHPGLRSAEYIPDGKYLITCASRDARLWDATTGRLLVALEDSEGFSQVRFRPDGGAVLTTHADGVRVWPLFFLSLFSSQPSTFPMRWVEVLTGMEFTSEGQPQRLDAAAWRVRRQSLEQSLGLSPPSADGAAEAGTP